MSSKSRKQYKRRTLPSKQKEKTEMQLLKETEKLAREVNSRLSSLRRHFKTPTYATKKLQRRLSTKLYKSWSIKSGRVKVKKNATETQLIYINKTLNNFLKSKTSTFKGIQDVKRKTIEQFKTSLGREKYDKETNEFYFEELTEDEAEQFFEMFGDDDFRYFIDNYHIEPSELQSIVDEAIEKEANFEGFDKLLHRYIIDLNDEDYRMFALSVYNKYVR